MGSKIFGFKELNLMRTVLTNVLSSNATMQFSVACPGPRVALINFSGDDSDMTWEFGEKIEDLVYMKDISRKYGFDKKRVTQAEYHAIEKLMYMCLLIDDGFLTIETLANSKEISLSYSGMAGTVWAKDAEKLEKNIIGKVEGFNVVEKGWWRR